MAVNVAPHPRLARYYSDERERTTRLRAAFDETASAYDAINRAMSLGTDWRYRLDALRRADVREGMSFLDVGCGTGIAAEHAQRLVGPSGMVIGIDPSAGMLAEAVKRNVANVVQGVGERLPFANNTFDFVCMSFALRHVADLLTTFKEYNRVLKPGGTVLLLEMTPPTGTIAFSLLKFYMKQVIPALTWLTTGRRTALTLYQYCWDTFEMCVPPDAILDAMRNAPFDPVARHVELRIFSEYRGSKPL
jgi:demethylmenaquinone methyltransferase / 2-methoxy-6-polyprenyl-1,4-benzoquinol methylase